MRTRLIAALSLAVAALALSACGSEGGTSAQPLEPATLTIEVSGSAKKSTLSAPKTTKAGLTELQLSGSAKGDHSIQLIRYDEGHSAQEAVKAGNAWGEGGKPLPDWVHLDGGIGSTGSSEPGSATVTLDPGTYVALDLEARGSAEFEVTGDASSEEPTAAATIEAKEYSFTATNLKEGRGEVLFENTGKEPHIIAGAPLKPGATIEDVKKFFETEKGAPPIDDAAGLDTAVLDGGRKQVVEFDLKAGKYALICFVPDRAGGPPHAAKGMISEVEVE